MLNSFLGAALALSVLPHSVALNPNEITRAIQQCKEQRSEMLEKACEAVEGAAQGTERATMNDSRTVLVLYFFSYAQERLNWHA